ncbi:MAG: DMT family transporter [Gammaproteobacteria bacterium]|nr:DMT family transporter [Gammaproteobacteria bacterium]
MGSSTEGQRARATLGLLCAVAGAVGFAFKSVLIKAAFRYGVDATTLLALRMLYALPLFLLMGLAAQRRAPLRPGWRVVGEFLLLGFLGYYAASYLDFLGLQYISAALERMILFVYPTLVVLIGVLWKRQRIAAHIALALALCYLGIALAVGHDLRAGNSGTVLRGGALVFASALCFALYLVRVGPTIARYGSMHVTAWATTAATLFVLVQFAALRPLHALAQPLPVHALSLAMAVFATVLPIWLVVEAIRRLGAGPTAIIGSLGPVLTLLLAWALLGEPVSALQLAGAALVIAGVWLVGRARSGR